MKYLRLLRVRHYVKNLLVVLPLVCSGLVLDGSRLFGTLVGTVAFCMLSSAVYVLNDIRDVERDRLHPTKRYRPIASGSVTVRQAWSAAIVLGGGSLLLGVALLPRGALACLVLYLALNVAYSLGLKDVPLLDVSVLASGFVLRVLYGGVVARVPVSDWLFLTVLVYALFFVLGKRRNELRRSAEGTRGVLGSYPQDFLDKGMYLCLCLGVVFYALWSMDAGTAARYHGGLAVYTVSLVLLISLRYCLVVEGDSDGDPVEVLLGDLPLVVLCLVYAAVMLTALYL